MKPIIKTVRFNNKNHPKLLKDNLIFNVIGFDMGFNLFTIFFFYQEINAFIIVGKTCLYLEEAT